MELCRLAALAHTLCVAIKEMKTHEIKTVQSTMKSHSKLLSDLSSAGVEEISEALRDLLAELDRRNRAPVVVPLRNRHFRRSLKFQKPKFHL